MERSIQKNGLINLLALLAVGVAGFAVARFANSLAGQVSVVFLGLGVLVAAVSWFQMRLEDRERLEKLELEELARTPRRRGAVRGQGRGGVPGAAVARAVRAVLRAGVHGDPVPAASRRGLFPLALAVAAARRAGRGKGAHYRAGAVWLVRAGAVPAGPVFGDHRAAGTSSSAAARGQLHAGQRLPVRWW